MAQVGATSMPQKFMGEPYAETFLWQKTQNGLF